MIIYTIEWSDCEGHRVLATFSNEEARDATFRKIEEIPWHSRPNYLKNGDWREKEVSFNPPDETGFNYGDRWVDDQAIHGTIWRGAYEVSEVPLIVYDTTRRD